MKNKRLPVGYWTENFKLLLEELRNNDKDKDDYNDTSFTLVKHKKNKK